MVADLVIKNGLVVTPQGIVPGGLSVEGGRIGQIAGDNALPSAREEVDASGNFIMPGVIDPHIHLGTGAERGMGEAKFAQDVQTESVCAAIAGVTTFLTTTIFGRFQESYLPTLERAGQIGRAHSLVDFKFNVMIMTRAHLAEIPRLYEEGVTSFKFVKAYRGEVARRLGIAEVEWDMVYEGLELIKSCGPNAIGMLHAEQIDVCEFASQRLLAQGRQDLPAWSEGRPSFCEGIDICTGGLMAHAIGVPLYIVHNTSRDAVAAIRWLKGRGARLYGETCPQYLTLTRQSPLGLYGKASPPLREDADRESLWQALADGTLDTMGSDHVVLARKHKEGNGIWDVAPGFDGMGAILPILISEGYNKGRLSIERIARITAENTARLLGMYPRKGALVPGADADVIVVDPHREWVMGAKTLRGGSDFSIYEGLKLRGRALKTFVRGRLVAQDGEAVAQPPHGVLVAPTGA